MKHQACDPHTSVHHDHSQTVDRTKFTPPATPSSLHTVEPYYSGVWLYQIEIMLTRERIVFRDEHHFQLCPDDHRRLADPAFTIARDKGR
ncbi:hypothetical protein TNCV_3482061 [Trichonephila clavipes]|nr:hypothetical protein TNCV_3482061 [Trichonephila clavipes]